MDTAADQNHVGFPRAYILKLSGFPTLLNLFVHLEHRLLFKNAGSIKKNNHVVIKGRPCKVMDVSTAKTGKHGHAKCTFTGLDVFNGKKYEDVIPAHQNVDVPYVKRRDYTLLDIQDDGFVSLLDDNTGDTKDDLKLPDDNEQLSNQIQKMMDEGKTVTCTVLAVRSLSTFIFTFRIASSYLPWHLRASKRAVHVSD